jgi:hypothetical protein
MTKGEGNDGRGQVFRNSEAGWVDADSGSPMADQRGEPRPGGTMFDVGVFEVQP